MPVTADIFAFIVSLLQILYHTGRLLRIKILIQYPG